MRFDEMSNRFEINLCKIFSPETVSLNILLYDLAQNQFDYKISFNIEKTQACPELKIAL